MAFRGMDTPGTLWKYRVISETRIHQSMH